jgi:5-(aminomethyl)-3-furanmethanol phosphate kinase
VLASNEIRIRRALRDGRVAVWVPTDLMRDTPDEMTNWDTTSDSLAAWLSTTLNAERLMVVKSCAVEAGTPLEVLSSKGVVDAHFAKHVADANYVVEMFNKGDAGLMRERLLHIPVA